MLFKDLKPGTFYRILTTESESEFNYFSVPCDKTGENLAEEYSEVWNSSRKPSERLIYFLFLVPHDRNPECNVMFFDIGKNGFYKMPWCNREDYSGFEEI